MLIVFLIGPPASGKTTYLTTIKNNKIIDDPINFDTDIKPFIFNFDILYIADPNLCNIDTLNFAEKLILFYNSKVTFKYLVFNQPYYLLKNNLIERSKVDKRIISTHTLNLYYNNLQNLIQIFNKNNIIYEIITYDRL